MSRFTLSKAQRLSSLKEITVLYAEGQSLTTGPIRLQWKIYPLEQGTHSAIKAMFGAPKRRFPRAVDRNRIKRQLREYYRLNRPTLEMQLPAETLFHLAIVYTGNEIPSHDAIQKHCHQALERWLRKINSTPQNRKSET